MNFFVENVIPFTSFFQKRLTPAKFPIVQNVKVHSSSALPLHFQQLPEVLIMILIAMIYHRLMKQKWKKR